ncbi:MAG: hypothetical protein LAO30_16095 [Acidobacteriia bacterium]|nr:hypothetical protein [Terriglobia bacterium]
MKLKSLLVITLLVIGCSFASAQTFGFGTAGGSYLYCNYVQLSNTFGAPFAVWQGVDNLSACPGFLGINATVVGIKGGMTATTNPLGVAIAGVTYGDNLYDAYAYGFTGAQWDVTQKLACNKYKNGHAVGSYRWIGFASVSGFVFGDNFGFLSCTIPGKAGSVPSRGVSFGSAKVAKKR